LALLASLALAFSAAPARAQGCDCLAVGQIARGAAERVVAGVAGPLEAAVARAASYETQNLHRDLVALREAVLAGQEAVSASIRAADRSAAERELERSFDAPSQPPSNCGGDAMGGALLGSRATGGRAGEAVMEKLYERRGRHGRPVDYLREMEAFPEPKAAAASLGALSSGRTLSAGELKSAERLIEGLSDPLPPPELPAAAAAAPAGRVYAARKRDYETRQGIYQSVLAKRLAARAPTMEGLSGWAAARWAEMGGAGEAPGLADGRMSREALLWMLSNMRLSSANWHERVLPALTEAGLLREMASMMAAGLELSRERNEHLENISMMMALDGLATLEAGAGEAVRLQYRRALEPAPE
jgi:hypothetical protein